MMPPRTLRLRFALWLVAVAALALSAATTRYTADLSAFLPAAPTAEQQLLVDQLREGPVSRLLLVAIEGPDTAQQQARAQLSGELVATLRASGEFTAVDNGATSSHERERELLFGHRYLLGDAVESGRLGAGMPDAIRQSLAQLASPLGLALKDLLPRDPTGEVLRLLEQLEPPDTPLLAHGAWVSGDGRRALVLAQLSSDGTELDDQQRALASVERAFAQARAKQPGLSDADARLLVSGTARFAVESRERIRGDVERLSGIGTVLIVLVLLLVYRSPRHLLLGLLPVVTGILAGIGAVRLGFGEVHGITMGFGIALIGEAIDYGIYLFVQGARPGLWPTMLLGLVASLIGFSALLLSGFPGLAQLGLFATSGLVAAFAVSRWVLAPWAAAHPLHLRLSAAPLHRVLAALRRLRALPLAATLVALVLLAVLAQRQPLWAGSLDALSPVSDADKALDERLRGDLRAPDIRNVIAVQGTNEDQALARARQVAGWLDGLVARGVLAGYDSPAKLIPDESVQRHRRDALPAADALRAQVRAAVRGLPLKPERLDGFVDDVQKSRALEPLRADDLRGTSLELAVDAMIVPGNGTVTAIMPLHPSSEDGHAIAIDAAQVRRAIGLEPSARGGPADPLPPGSVALIDIKAETDGLYSRYLSEARGLSLAGAALIVLLVVGTRRRRLGRIVVPLAAATSSVLAALALAGVGLNLLHLVGLLLTVAVGSNYALFFADDQDSDRRLPYSLLLAATTTTIGFGILAFASVPVLSAIGVTVGPGAVLSLLFSAMLSRPAAAGDGPARDDGTTRGDGPARDDGAASA